MGTTKIEWCQNSDGTRGKIWNPIMGNYPNRFDVTVHQKKLEQPLHWKKPCRVFVCSMGDLHHENVRYEWLHQVYRMMEKTPRHTYMVLTKRPDLMRAFLPAGPSHNVWLGVTVEHQATIVRVTALAEIEAAVRFVLYEPLLGVIRAKHQRRTDWAIIGAETGPGRRPCNLSWVEKLIDDYSQYGTSIFVKQLEIDGRITKDMSEWPEWARRREFPGEGTND